MLFHKDPFGDKNSDVSMKTQQEINVSIRLSAQRALWGVVPPALRSVSVDAQEPVVYFRCIFDRDATEDDKELLSCAATELIADFPDSWDIKEEYLVIPVPERMQHLKFLVFQRYEADKL